jgi:hypothetical protein
VATCEEVGGDGVGSPLAGFLETRKYSFLIISPKLYEEVVLLTDFFSSLNSGFFLY